MQAVCYSCSVFTPSRLLGVTDCPSHVHHDGFDGYAVRYRLRRRVAFLSRGRWVTVPPTPLGVPTYLQKCTTSGVRGHPPTHRKVRHSVNLVLNLVLRSIQTKFSTVVGGPTYLQKCTTSVVRGDPPTYRNVRRWHRNPPTPGKERNPAQRSRSAAQHRDSAAVRSTPA
jgi:hypothetical protein